MMMATPQGSAFQSTAPHYEETETDLPLGIQLRYAMEYAYDRMRADMEMGMQKAKIGAMMGAGQAFEDVQKVSVLKQRLQPSPPRYYDPHEMSFMGSLKGTFLPQRDIRNMTPGGYQQIARRDLAERLGLMTAAVPTEIIAPTIAFGVGGALAGGGLPGMAVGLAAGIGMDMILNTDVFREHLVRGQFLERTSGRYIRPGQSSALDGSGFSRQQIGDLTRFIEDTGRGDPFFTADEIDQLTEQFTFTGQFDAVRSTNDFRRAFTRAKDNLKMVMQEMGTSLEEGIGVLQSLTALGIEQTEVPTMIRRSRIAANQMGISQPEALSLSMQQGAGLFSGTGVELGLGTQLAANNIEDIGRLEATGRLRAESLRQLGGPVGASNRLAQLQASLLQRPEVNRILMAAYEGGVSVNEQTLGEALSGVMGTGAVARRASSHMRGAERLAFEGRKAEMMSTLSPRQLQHLTLMPLINMAKQLKQARPDLEEITPEIMRGLAIRHLGLDPNEAELLTAPLFDDDTGATQAAHLAEQSSFRKRMALDRSAQFLRYFSPDTYKRMASQWWGRTIIAPMTTAFDMTTDWYDRTLEDLTGVYRVTASAPLDPASTAEHVTYRERGMDLLREDQLEHLLPKGALEEVAAGETLQAGEMLLSDGTTQRKASQAAIIKALTQVRTLQERLRQPFEVPGDDYTQNAMVQKQIETLRTRRQALMNEGIDPTAATLGYVLHEMPGLDLTTARGRGQMRAVLAGAGADFDALQQSLEGFLTTASPEFRQDLETFAAGGAMPDLADRPVERVGVVRQGADLRPKGSSWTYDTNQEVYQEAILSGQFDVGGLTLIHEDDLKGLSDAGEFTTVADAPTDLVRQVLQQDGAPDALHHGAVPVKLHGSVADRVAEYQAQPGSAARRRAARAARAQGGEAPEYVSFSGWRFVVPEDRVRQQARASNRRVQTLTRAQAEGPETHTAYVDAQRAAVGAALDAMAKGTGRDRLVAFAEAPDEDARAQALKDLGDHLRGNITGAIGTRAARWIEELGGDKEGALALDEMALGSGSGRSGGVSRRARALIDADADRRHVLRTEIQHRLGLSGPLHALMKQAAEQDSDSIKVDDLYAAALEAPDVRQWVGAQEGETVQELFERAPETEQLFADALVGSAEDSSVAGASVGVQRVLGRAVHFGSLRDAEMEHKEAQEAFGVELARVLKDLGGASFTWRQTTGRKGTRDRQRGALAGLDPSEYMREMVELADIEADLHALKTKEGPLTPAERREWDKKSARRQEINADIQNPTVRKRLAEISQDPRFQRQIGAVSDVQAGAFRAYFTRRYGYNADKLARLAQESPETIETYLGGADQAAVEALEGGADLIALLGDREGLTSEVVDDVRRLTDYSRTPKDEMLVAARDRQTQADLLVGNAAAPIKASFAAALTDRFITDQEVRDLAGQIASSKQQNEWKGMDMAKQLPAMEKVVAAKVHELFPGFDQGDESLYAMLRKRGSADEAAERAANIDAALEGSPFSLSAGTGFATTNHAMTAGTALALERMAKIMSDTTDNQRILASLIKDLQGKQ